MSFIRNICGCGSGGEAASTNGGHSASKTRALAGRSCCEIDKGKAVGAAALATGIAMVILAIIFASGVFGAGDMYFVAAGLAVGSLVPLCLAARQLACKPSKVQTLGSLDAARRGVTD